MNAGLVEFRQQQQEPVDIHRPGSLVGESSFAQDAGHFVFDGKVFRQLDFLGGALDAEVLVENGENRVGLETGAESLVLAREGDPSQRIPLFEVDRRRRIARLDAHDRRLHFRWRPEVVFADLDIGRREGEEGWGE